MWRSALSSSFSRTFTPASGGRSRLIGGIVVFIPDVGVMESTVYGGSSRATADLKDGVVLVWLYAVAENKEVTAMMINKIVISVINLLGMLVFVAISSFVFLLLLSSRLFVRINI